MGPYYFAALLTMLGSIKRVAGSAEIAIPERVIGSGARKGNTIEVTTPDHLAGTIEFCQGAVVSMVMSFAIRYPEYDREYPVTIYGTEGVLKMSDPNAFDGLVQIKKDGNWEEIVSPFQAGYGRMAGLAEMCAAIEEDRPHRCTGEQAIHMLEAMLGFVEASHGCGYNIMASTYERPAPLDPTLPFGIF
jgi:predicted dehydrogenase